MAEELFVDIQYRGLEFGRRVRMEEFASSQAYLHHPLPMPVGSMLQVEVGDGLEISVQVARVSEQVAGAEKPPGMIVKPVELGDRQQRWWDGRVASTEGRVAIVEDLKASGEEASEPAVPAPEVAKTASAAAAEVAQAPVESQPAEESAPKGKRKRRRKKRPTKA